MIKLTISSNIENLHDFIDERLLLLMGEKKLRQIKPPNVSNRILFKDEYMVKNIDNSILLLEKKDKELSYVITTSEQIKKSDNPTYDAFGVKIIKKNENEVELYIDLLEESFKKGFFKDEMKRSIFKWKKVGIALLAIFLLLVVLASSGLALIGVAAFYAIYAPIMYFILKRKFKKIQMKMKGVVSIFESEFNIVGKTETKDWVNMWGIVKSEFDQELKVQFG